MTVLMPSLPPAICNTTRMVESFPVVICVALSMASACSAEKVFARNVGTVQERALVRTVRRRNSRRVWRVISFFITSGDLIIGSAHHEANGVADVVFVQCGFAVEIFAQGALLPGGQVGLQQPFFESGNQPLLVRALLFGKNFFHVHAARA